MLGLTESAEIRSWRQSSEAVKESKAIEALIANMRDMMGLNRWTASYDPRSPGQAGPPTKLEQMRRQAQANLSDALRQRETAQVHALVGDAVDLAAADARVAHAEVAVRYAERLELVLQRAIDLRQASLPEACRAVQAIEAKEVARRMTALAKKAMQLVDQLQPVVETLSALITIERADFGGADPNTRTLREFEPDLRAIEALPVDAGELRFWLDSMQQKGW